VVCKLIPCLLLLCGFVYAQQTPSKVKKPAKPKSTKNNTIVNQPADTLKPVKKDSALVFVEDVWLEPEDTTPVKISKDAIKSQVNYSARDSMPYDAVNRIYYMYGNAKVTQDDLTLEAEFIKADLANNIVTATGVKDSTGRIKGKPVFKQGTSEYRAEVIKYNTRTKRGYLSEFRTKEGEGYIHGEDVGKTAENSFNIEHAKYTTCNLDSPHYHIAASRIKVIPDKKVVTGVANLQFEGIPSPLILPFGIFSIKRGQSSGIIIPSYGSSTDRGYFLRDGGYYFGLGEHADYRLTGSFYANGSWALNNGLRYSSRYHFAGDLSVNYAYNQFNEELDPNYSLSKDFMVSWNHRSDPKARPYTSFNASVNIVSVNSTGSSYLQNNSYNPANIVNNQLNSSISYNKGFKNGKYNLTANARMSQNTSTRDVQIVLPDLTFTVSSFNPFKSNKKPVAEKWYENISMNYTTSFRNQVNTKDSILFGGLNGNTFPAFFDTAGRYGMAHNIPIQTSFKILKYYTLSASVTLNEYWYGQTIRKVSTSEGVQTLRVNGFERAFTYTPRVGLNTRYYGIKHFSGNKITAIRHVASPSIDFSYNPDYADSKYGYYRTYLDEKGNSYQYSIFEQGIVGGPGAGRQGNVGFSLDNNIEMKIKQGKDTAQKENKVQIFESLRAGGSYNLFADSLNLSPINFSGRTRLFKNISLNASTNMDPYINDIRETEGFKTVVRRNEYYAAGNGSLGLITDANIGVNASFNASTFKKKTTNRKEYSGDLKYINDRPEDYYDFNIPWTFSVNYTIGYNRYNNLNNPDGTNYIQTLNFNGDFNLTGNWKIGYTSGYDIKNKEITFTSIDFIRQLHCWEFKLNWIPVGSRQSFLFTINVKSSLLQDLKLTRRKDWFDRKI